MIETIVIGLICVFWAYLGRYRRLSWGFGAAMTILFVFLAIRYEWGNDYRQYIDKFTEYNSIDEFNYSDPNERLDILVSDIQTIRLFFISHCPYCI